MTEYKAGDPIWVKATVVVDTTPDNDVLAYKSGTRLAGQRQWCPKGNACPRVDGAASDESDAARLRATLQDMVDWFANTRDPRNVGTMVQGLRAALAATPVGTPISRAEALSISQETIKRAEAERAEPTPEPPIEGPVQVGDMVRLEGVVEEVNGNDTFCMVRSQSDKRWVDVKSLTIVSRPAPAHTCGECRWLATIPGANACRGWREARYNRQGADAACPDFELYAPKEPRR